MLALHATRGRVLATPKRLERRSWSCHTWSVSECRMRNNGRSPGLHKAAGLVKFLSLTKRKERDFPCSLAWEHFETRSKHPIGGANGSTRKRGHLGRLPSMASHVEMMLGRFMLMKLRLIAYPHSNMDCLMPTANTRGRCGKFVNSSCPRQCPSVNAHASNHVVSDAKK
jgi:hypothetical protein